MKKMLIYRGKMVSSKNMDFLINIYIEDIAAKCIKIVNISLMPLLKIILQTN